MGIHVAQIDKTLNCYVFCNSHLQISRDATGGNTSMIALRAEKMADGHGSPSLSVRLSRAELPETQCHTHPSIDLGIKTIRRTQP